MGNGTRKQARTARWQKATALLPLVLLSGAISANAATGDRGQLAAATVPDPAGAPAVPSTAFDQPASVALPGGAMADLTAGLAGLAPDSSFTFPTGDAPATSSSSMSVNGIPASALSAYQRAAAILNQADPACNIDWSLVAAIGRVESDHGRYGGNALDEQGKAQPGIYGLPLDGANGTARILDTDGGAYDNDGVYDRAVGPMQFIPGTWSVAGVDADQDGAKDPQDIDDAATASAVYLCAGSDDLATDAGKRAAVYRYNHSDEYVDLVLSIAATYSGGEYTAVPNGTPSSTTLVSEDFAATPDGRPAVGTRNRPSGGTAGGSTSGGTASSGGSVSGGGGGGDGSSDGGSRPEGGSNPPDDRDNNPDDGDNDPVAPGPDPEPAPPGGDDPVGDAVDDVKKRVGDVTNPSPSPRPSPAPAPTPDVLSLSEARQLCASQVPAPLVGTCTDQVVGKTRDQALGIIAGLL